MPTRPVTLYLVCQKRPCQQRSARLFSVQWWISGWTIRQMVRTAAWTASFPTFLTLCSDPVQSIWWLQCPQSGQTMVLWNICWGNIQHGECSHGCFNGELQRGVKKAREWAGPTPGAGWHRERVTSNCCMLCVSVAHVPTSGHSNSLFHWSNFRVRVAISSCQLGVQLLVWAVLVGSPVIKLFCATRPAQMIFYTLLWGG